jgi:chaperonin GroES
MKFVLGLVTLLSAQSALAFTVIGGGAAATSRSTTTRCYGTLDGKAIDGDFNPVNNMVLIKLDSKREETDGGLLLSSKIKVKKNEGTVIAAGDGKVNQETGFKMDMPVEKGEKVVYGAYSGSQLNYNGDLHVLIPDSDILVKYTGEKLNMETVTMLRDNVLVKVFKKDEAESSSGILLAKSSTGKAKPTVGEVVKVGPGRYAMNGKLMEMDVEGGDQVRFRDFAGNTVEIDDVEYSVVRMNDVLAKF